MDATYFTVRGKRLGRDDPPRVRLGICCGRGCMRNIRRRGRPDVTLYKVGDEYRYRCRSCYRRETGYFP